MMPDVDELLWNVVDSAATLMRQAHQSRSAGDAADAAIAVLQSLSMWAALGADRYAGVNALYDAYERIRGNLEASRGTLAAGYDDDRR